MIQNSVNRGIYCKASTYLCYLTYDYSVYTLCTFFFTFYLQRKCTVTNITDNLFSGLNDVAHKFFLIYYIISKISFETSNCGQGVKWLLPFFPRSEICPMLLHIILIIIWLHQNCGKNATTYQVVPNLKMQKEAFFVQIKPSAITLMWLLLAAATWDLTFSRKNSNPQRADLCLRCYAL